MKMLLNVAWRDMTVYMNDKRYIQALFKAAMLPRINVYCSHSRTAKLTHLQKNIWASDFEFSADEFKQFTEELSCIKFVGERYTGVQAEQTKK